MAEQKLIYSLIMDALTAAIIWKCYKKSTASADQKYSTFWPRFWASCVDSCVLWPLNVITYILTFDLSAFLALCLWLMQGIGFYFYQVFMHGKYGQTIGKMVCKIKVLNFNKEDNINYKTALLRDSIPIALFMLVLVLQFYFIAIGKLTINELYSPTSETIDTLYLIPIFWFVVELISMLTNEKRRALHDYIAGTVVARTNITKGLDGIKH